jgi:hypothetical protein
MIRVQDKSLQNGFGNSVIVFLGGEVDRESLIMGKYSGNDFMCQGGETTRKWYMPLSVFL